MNVHLRADRVVFKASGPDAAKLLHDTLTGRVEASAATGSWWALLTPQGKIVAEGLIGWSDGAFWLDVHRDCAVTFAKMMRLYKMRANVVVEDLGESHVVGWSDISPSGGVAHADPRGGGLGYRVISGREDAESWSGDATAYQQKCVAGGVIEVGADCPPTSQFAHDIGMDFNGGIDFNKGCYIGQEVVSRMKHRGTARRRPVIISDVSGASGDSVLVGERNAGELAAVSGDRAVAIVRLDRIEPDQAVTVNGKTVTLALPDWASYRFGDSGPA